MMTTVYLSLCLDTLVYHRRLKPKSNPSRGIVYYNISSLTGLSHDAIARQSMEYAHYGGMDPEEQRREYKSIADILSVDNSWGLIKALEKYKFIPRSVALARSCSSILRQPSEDKDAYNWHSHMARAWQGCLELSRRQNDVSLTLQAIDSGMLFVLEEWGSVMPRESSEKRSEPY